MYDQILYPTDGSTGAQAALENVRTLAETYDATVHVLYAIEPSRPALGIGDDPNKEHSPGMVGDPEGGEAGMIGDRLETEEVRTQLEEHARAIVDEVAGRLEGVETETVVETGDPHEVILGYADDSDVDLMVMGTHGRTGLERYLLGSVTEKVVRMSDVPVVTVREGED